MKISKDDFQIWILSWWIGELMYTESEGKGGIVVSRPMI